MLRIFSIIGLSIILFSKFCFAQNLDNEVKNVYIIDKSKLVYQGPDALQQGDLIHRKSLNDLRIAGKQDDKKTIALLVYPVKYPIQYSNMKLILNGVLWRTYKELLDYKLEFDKTPEDAYGYSIKYNVADNKFFIEYYADHSSSRLTDLEAKSTRFRKNLSMELSQIILDDLTSNGFKVINLTDVDPREFQNLTPQGILKQIKARFDVNHILIVPYDAYTKWFGRDDYEYRPHQTERIGLLLAYRAFIFKDGSNVPIFQYGDSINATPDINEFVFNNLKLKFYALENDVYSKGVLDDEFLINNILKKFKGYSDEFDENKKIGGLLFEKFKEDLY